VLLVPGWAPAGGRFLKGELTAKARRKGKVRPLKMYVPGFHICSLSCSMLKNIIHYNRSPGPDGLWNSMNKVTRNITFVAIKSQRFSWPPQVELICLLFVPNTIVESMLYIYLAYISERQYYLIVKTKDSCLRLPHCESWSHHLSVWPWASFFNLSAPQFPYLYNEMDTTNNKSMPC
jgi:hypothetical protein